MQDASKKLQDLLRWFPAGLFLISFVEMQKEVTSFQIYMQAVKFYAQINFHHPLHFELKILIPS